MILFLNVQMFKLIRRRKKRTKEKRKKWLKRSRPRSEHQKHKKLNEFILTWQPNYNWKKYGKKNLDVFFSWNFHIFPSHYWYCPFLLFVWLRTSINQGMETWNVFDWINYFHYSFSSSSISNSNSCHGLNIWMTLCKSGSIYFGIAQISFYPSPLAPSAIWALWGTISPRNQPG